MTSVRRIQVNQNMSHDEWSPVTINGETVWIGLRASPRANIHAIDIQFGEEPPIYADR